MKESLVIHRDSPSLDFPSHPRPDGSAGGAAGASDYSAQRNLVREDKRRRPVVETDHEHPAVQIVEVANNSRALIEMVPALSIANRFQESALTAHRVGRLVLGFHESMPPGNGMMTSLDGFPIHLSCRLSCRVPSFEVPAIWSIRHGWKAISGHHLSYTQYP
jgi:hypothetical protein